MTSHSPHQRKSRRATAWFLLLVCFWMGSGGVLHHTEAAASGRVVAHGPNGLHRPAAIVPADGCAACEWTQGLLGRTLAVTRVALPLFSLRPRPAPLSPAPLRRVARLGSSRAPPAFLSPA